MELRRFRQKGQGLRGAAATIFALTTVLPVLVTVFLFSRSDTFKETQAQVSLLIALVIAFLGFVLLRGLIDRVSRLAQTVAAPAPTEASARPSDAVDVSVPGFGRLDEISQIAAAFDRLFEDMRASTERLEDLVFKLGTLNEMVELTSKIPKIQDLLALVLERTMRAVKARSGTIMLLDQECRVLRIAVARGLPDEVVASAQIRYGEGIAGRVAQFGEAVVVDDTETDPRFAGESDLPAVYGGGPFICMPIRAGDRLIGVINLAKKEYGAAGTPTLRPFSPTELQFLNSLMTHIAYAVDNARLLEEARQAANRLGEVVADQQVKLTLAQQQMVQTEKLSALGRLLAGVAHELNNPLAVVLGQSVLMRKAVGTGPFAERAEQISQAADRCARIVRMFLAVARQHPPERQKVQLNQVIEEALALFACQLEADGVAVTCHLADDLPCLWADPDQLHQVVVNLVANAQHATRETPPPRRVSLTTRYDAAQARLSLEVADSGPGIPPELRTRIFEPFFTTKPLGQGTGLGLSLCQGIVEQHGGFVRVDDEPGHGAVFTVDLPVQGHSEAGQEGRAVEAPPSIPGKRILVVDDEPAVVAMLAEMLAADGHLVDTAANGSFALAKLGESTYDVILSDLKMPGLDGPGLYRELERTHPEYVRRVIFLTGDALNPPTREFLDQTGAPSLSKPFALDELRWAVRDVLQAAGAGDLRWDFDLPGPGEIAASAAGPRPPTGPRDRGSAPTGRSGRSA